MTHGPLVEIMTHGHASLLMQIFPPTNQMKFLLIACFLLGTACAGVFNTDSFQPIIEEVNSLQTTWQADPNFPSDVTISSIERLFGFKKSGIKLPAREKLILNEPIPEEFDARKKWPNCPTISSISDQSNCGSCWAVSSGDSYSDRLCIATKGGFTTPLSVEQLLSCCEICGSGCGGGDPFEAWNYFKDTGIVTGGGYNSSIGCQPYPFPPCEHGRTKGSFPPCSSLPEYKAPTCQNKCTNEAYNKPFTQDIHKAKSAYSIESVEEIQKEIMTHGPVVAGFDAYADFPTYKSGVYKHVTGKLLAGHAVRVIGWGTENGTPYWLIANSWNTHWGDQGLFKMLRGQNECGIEGDVTAGIPL